MLKGIINKDATLSQILVAISENGYSGIIYIGDIEDNQILVKEGKIVFANYNNFQNEDALKEIALSEEKFEFVQQEKVFFRSDFENKTEQVVANLKKLEEDFLKVRYLKSKFVTISDDAKDVNLTSEEIKFLASLDFKPEQIEKLLRKVERPVVETLTLVQRLAEKGILKVYEVKNPKFYQFLEDNYPELTHLYEKHQDNLKEFERLLLEDHRDISKVVLRKLRELTIQ